MSGDARITGRISIDPPITWGELGANRWALGQERVDGQGWVDAVVHLDSAEEVLPDGVMTRYLGVAIIPAGGETNGYTLVADVDRIAKAFGRAPDGTVRRFAGWLHLIWGGEAVYRVIVRDGVTVEVQPQVVWPEGARDEDAVGGAT